MFLGHIGVGFAAKRVAPKIPVLVLILASMIIDILAFIFMLTGFKSGSMAWSHGLFMSVIWSLATLFITALIYRDFRTGAFIGAMVFIHWILDWISHPIKYIGNGLPDLPLFFEGSPKVGLGMYITIVGIIIGELGLLIPGIIIYVRYRKQMKNQGKTGVKGIEV